MIHPKLSSERLPWPTDWAELFGVERPLIVEIGFGSGDYLVALADEYPDHNIIGFEIANRSLEKGEGKISRENLTNARVIASRAETALHHLFTPASVREFHINYPDPWFKKRHADRRLIQEETVAALTNRLQPEGLLYLATDILEYAEMSHEILSQAPGLENTLNTPWAEALPERLITTKYEQQGIREGRPGKYFRYRRTHAPAPDVPVYEELPMPHVILETPMSPPAIVEEVEKKTHRPGNGITIVMLAGFYNPTYNSALFEVLVNEPTIEQRVGLLLAPRNEGDQSYTLKYASLGYPRTTEGIHHATGFVADWVAGLHPDARVTARRISE